MEPMLERATLSIQECCNGLVGRAAGHQAELNQEIAKRKKHEKDKGATVTSCSTSPALRLICSHPLIAQHLQNV
jgi:hypothetical protein